MIEINSAFKSDYESKCRYLVKRGGAGSGKSYYVYQKHFLKAISQPYYRGVMLRKNYTSLKDSVFANIISIISKENMMGEFKITTHPLTITHYSTGNQFIFRGLKDPKDREKIKSIYEPTNIVMEEANEFDQDDFSEADRRLRGSADVLRQFDILFNPVDEEHWLKPAFFDDPIRDPNQIFLHHSTYKDNLQFLDPEYIESLESLIREDENLYRIYVLGEWGTVDNRGRIYKRFIDKPVNEGGHLYNWEYNPNHPIILACDFNIDPMKWALIQNIRGIDYVFDEIVQIDTDTERMVKEVIEKYPNGEFYVYGDYSGTYGHTVSRTTDYEIIEQYIPNAVVRVQPNPPVVNRINSLNWRLLNRENVKRLFVHERCKNVRTDFKKSKFIDGTRKEDKSMEKYDGKNPVNALIHISSAIGYYIEYEYSLKGKPSFQKGNIYDTIRFRQ